MSASPSRLMGNGEMHSGSHELRPRQQKAVDELLHHIEQRQRVLLVMPTGAGKTVVAATVIAEVVSRNWHVLAVAHRRELIAQLSRILYSAGVQDHGILLPGFPTRPNERVQIGSIQTVHARTVVHRRIEAPPANLVVVDEAHHAPADTYQQLLRAYPGVPAIGLTATPVRGDGRGLGDIFDVLIEPTTVAQEIEDGFLVPTITYAPYRPDLHGVQVSNGDYVESQLALRMDRPGLVGGVVEHWHKHADNRRTVLFATGVAHSLHLRDEFRRSGVVAEHIDGGTPTAERDAILAALASGDVQVVTNCMVLTEGFDCPDIGCLILARPTRQLGLYRQMVGRGLRPSPGKTDCLVLDHAGAIFAHGLAEEDIQWTLDVDRRAINRVHEARAADHREPQILTCPECRAVRKGGQACPACGWQPKPRAAAVDIADGELARVARDQTVQVVEHAPDEKLIFYRMLEAIRRERGFAPGWTAHKYREKFGAWPPLRNPQPLEPTPAVRSWVRSRAIAYAREMERRLMGGTR